MFVPVLEGLRIGRRGPGRPRTHPDRLRGDKAYSSRGNRAYLRRRGIKATIAQPDDQRASRKRRGPAGGRPRPSTRPSTGAATPPSGASANGTSGASANGSSTGP
jgi:hypothetical protein